MEKKMKSKIGKLGNLGELKHLDRDTWIVMAINSIIEKQNEIIDYLNSQSQPEGMTSEQYNKFFNPLVKDTSEEWESRLGTILNDNCIDVMCDEGRELIADINSFIRKLLDDREREMLEEIKQKFCGGFVIGFNQKGVPIPETPEIDKWINEKLKLLNSKKK